MIFQTLNLHKNKLFIIIIFNLNNFIKKIIFSHNIYKKWGLGIGDWGLGIGEWGLGPITNPQSPIPNFPTP